MKDRTAPGRLSAVMLSVSSVLILVGMLFPLYWIVVTSLKKEIEIFRVPPTLVPQVLNTESYSAQIQHGDFNMFRSFKNSFVISFSAMLISLVLAIPFFLSDSLVCEHRQVLNRAPCNNGTQRRVEVVEFEFYTAEGRYF